MDWLFQCNPKRYDLAAFLEGGGTHEDWSMNQGRNLVSPGDRVFFWQSGENARLLAIGQVASPVYERASSDFGRYCVDIAFQYKIVPPLTREEVLSNPTLQNFTPFKGMQGTNFVIRDPVIILELNKVTNNRLLKILMLKEIIQPIDKMQEAENAIKNAALETTSALRNHLSKMEANTFELLVRAVFTKLGYQDVVVTKRSGDAGIDVKAVLAAEGVGNIRTCIQVKRQQSPVGRPIVQNLRGSLGAHEVGIIVASSGFTDEAREDAQDPTKAPIALIGGQEVAELLVKYEIGVQHIERKLYRLAIADLTPEKLQDVAEIRGNA